MNDYATKTKLRTRAIVLQTVFPTQLTKAFGKYLGVLDSLLQEN